MNEQLSHQSPDETSQTPQTHEEAEAQLVMLASAELSIRGLHAVFTIGAINATRTWRRIRGGTVPSEETPDGQAHLDGNTDKASSDNS